MPEDKRITLPDEDELLRRLEGVGLEGPYTKDLFPYIASNGGREMRAEGVPLMLVLSIHNYVEDLDVSPDLSNTGQRVFHALLLPRLIDAIIDDEELAERAKKLYAERVEATS